MKSSEDLNAALQEENDRLRASLLTVRGHLENLQIQVAQQACPPTESLPARSTPPPEETGQSLNARSPAERIMTDIELRDPGILARIEDGMFHETPCMSKCTVPPLPVDTAGNDADAGNS